MANESCCVHREENRKERKDTVLPAFFPTLEGGVSGSNWWIAAITGSCVLQLNFNSYVHQSFSLFYNIMDTQSSDYCAFCPCDVCVSVCAMAEEEQERKLIFLSVSGKQDTRNISLFLSLPFLSPLWSKQGLSCALCTPHHSNIGFLCPSYRRTKPMSGRLQQSGREWEIEYTHVLVFVITVFSRSYYLDPAIVCSHKHDS